MSDWEPFTTKGVPVAAEYRREGDDADLMGTYQVGPGPDTVIDTGPSLVACLAEIDYLAALLDGVMADDPAAIRDAAAWLAANRPEVEG